MKYIMIETSEGEKIPVIFAESLVHANVADVMKRVIGYERKGRVSTGVVSAGFVSFPVTPTVAGESESLDGIKSRSLDGFRMQAGTAVSHMPDAMLVGLADRAASDAKIKGMYPDLEQPHPDDTLKELAEGLSEKMHALAESLERIKGEPEYPHRLQQFLFRLLRDHPEIDYAAHLAQTEHEIAVYDTEAIDIAQTAEFLASELLPK